MKNRWVKTQAADRICYGQIQDAGPGVYDDAAYVFGSDDRRPENSRYNGAGMDVSPALNGCLAFADLDGATIGWTGSSSTTPTCRRSLADPRDDGRGDAVNLRSGWGTGCAGCARAADARSWRC